MFDLQCQLHITTVPELCQKLPSQHIREPNGCVGWGISGTFSFAITVCQTCLVSHPPRTNSWGLFAVASCTATANTSQQVLMAFSITTTGLTT